MPLSFAQAQFALAFVNQISPKRADAFEARLKQWQKMGFPEGVNVGRGTRAAYGATQIFQLLIMMRLLQVGLTPDRAQRVVLAGWAAFKDAIVEATLCMAAGADHVHYSLIQLDALSELKEPATDHMHVFVDTFTSDEIVEAFVPDDVWLASNEGEFEEGEKGEFLAQHHYLTFLTKNRLATSITIEIDSLLAMLWVALTPMGVDPSIFAEEFKDWESQRRERGRVEQPGQSYHDEHTFGSVAQRIRDFDVCAAAQKALALVASAPEQ